VLPAEARVLSQVRRLVRRWLRHLGADDEELIDVTLAVGEACGNAIEHAYSPAPAAFELEARASGRELTVAVRDRGRWRESRGEHRGRGLRIIHAAMDEVEVKPAGTGTEIIMRRRLGQR
jgi:anti-sigma regulatory factor (Ser/Thr protein kinase)